MFRRFVATLLTSLAFISAAGALGPSAHARQQQQGVSDVVMILPFENTSGLKDFNWVGESFSDQLADLLGSHGLRVVSSDARELAYQRLRVPLTVIPSRATSIKLAQQAGATLVVLGTYEVSPARDDKTPPEVRGSARMIRVNEGRIAGRETRDGRWETHEFLFGDALLNLQTVQGKLAYEILYEQDDKLPFSQKSIVEQATKVPQRAFEARVKATMTSDQTAKLNYLTNAMKEFERANPGSVYKEAAFELGHLHYGERPPDYKKAAEYFSMLQHGDPHYAEAAFYAALAYWRAGELQSALDVLLPLTVEVPLTSIYNNAGALSTQAALKEKDAQKRAALLKQATNFLSRAADSVSEESPDSAMVRYNYAYALVLSGKFEEAAEQLDAVVKENSRDPEAVFLLAKAQEKAGKSEAATENDNRARQLYSNYAKAQVEWQQSQTTSLLPVHLRGDFNRADMPLIVGPPPSTVTEGASVDEMLAKARELYDAGRDDEALMHLRDVVRTEPMNAGAYLLTGRIYQRRGELAAAINQLKTSIFWDKNLIDAHILLGRIFLERGDRAQALAYSQSAMQIDPNNQEALALQRQLQVGIK
ncbi:MAG: tetratricopeptide repeat protein [Pyrinomonadaceae bacterium]